MNSPRLAVPQCVTDHVLLVALRTSDVWAGERGNDSLALAVTDAVRRGVPPYGHRLVRIADGVAHSRPAHPSAGNGDIGT